MVKRECSEFWVLHILLLYKAITDVITSRGDGSGRQLGHRNITLMIGISVHTRPQRSVALSLHENTMR